MHLTAVPATTEGLICSLHEVGAHVHKLVLSDGYTLVAFLSLFEGKN